MPKVYFKNENISVNADPDITIMEAMRAAGMVPDAPCGGNGKCGKCRVYVIERSEYVLSCQSIVGDKDITVSAEEPAQNVIVLQDGLSKETAFNSHITRISLKVPPCPAGKSISDWTRFREELIKLLPDLEERIVPDPCVITKLPGALKAAEGNVHVMIASDHILDVSAERKEAYMAAFDIGTTTVAGYLLDADTGKKLSVASRLNPQVQFGGDVISRAAYSLEHGGEELSACIRTALRELIAEMTEKAGCTPENVYLVSIAGNTCMHHLFMGIDVDSLVHAPYNPAVCEKMVLPAENFGLGINKNGLLFALPNIAGFVGADTVACIVSSDIAEQKNWTLLIDIGTNGEMVLAKDHKMAACSTAAGPAFEGVGIAFGMRGADGAISKAEYTEDGWKLGIINDKPAVGICGSGLLDLAGEMLRVGIMDESGEMEEEKIVLVPAEKSGRGTDVYICQKDIREMQMAKAAIRAGIELLCAHMGITVDDVSEVWLAGAFGSFLNPQNVCRIGMIPPVLRDRITPIGNAAGLGAQMVLQNKELWTRAGELAAETDFLELASLPEFQDTFVDALEFDNF